MKKIMIGKKKLFGKRKSCRGAYSQPAGVHPGGGGGGGGAAAATQTEPQIAPTNHDDLEVDVPEHRPQRTGDQQLSQFEDPEETERRQRALDLVADHKGEEAEQLESSEDILRPTDLAREIDFSDADKDWLTHNDNPSGVTLPSAPINVTPSSNQRSLVIANGRFTVNGTSYDLNTMLEAKQSAGGGYSLQPKQGQADDLATAWQNQSFREAMYRHTITDWDSMVPEQRYALTLAVEGVRRNRQGAIVGRPRSASQQIGLLVQPASGDRSFQQRFQALTDSDATTALGSVLRGNPRQAQEALQQFDGNTQLSTREKWGAVARSYDLEASAFAVNTDTKNSTARVFQHAVGENSHVQDGQALARFAREGIDQLWEPAHEAEAIITTRNERADQVVGKYTSSVDADSGTTTVHGHGHSFADEVSHLEDEIQGASNTDNVKALLDDSFALSDISNELGVSEDVVRQAAAYRAQDIYTDRQRGIAEGLSLDHSRILGFRSDVESFTSFSDLAAAQPQLSRRLDRQGISADNFSRLGEYYNLEDAVQALEPIGNYVELNDTLETATTNAIDGERQFSEAYWAGDANTMKKFTGDHTPVLSEAGEKAHEKNNKLAKVGKGADEVVNRFEQATNIFNTATGLYQKIRDLVVQDPDPKLAESMERVREAGKERRQRMHERADKGVENMNGMLGFYQASGSHEKRKASEWLGETIGKTMAERSEARNISENPMMNSLVFANWEGDKDRYIAEKDQEEAEQKKKRTASDDFDYLSRSKFLV